MDRENPEEQQVHTDNEETNGDEDQVVFIRQTENDFQRIGMAQIVFGCISVISCAATLAAARGPFSLDRSGAGIWCGVLAIIAGSLSISARYHRPYTLILSNMVVSIVTGLFGFGLCVAYFIFSLRNLFRDSMELTSLYLFQTSIALCWTTLAIYNAVTFSHITTAGKRNICQMTCCPQSVPNYPAMTMMYIPQMADNAPLLR